MKLDKLNDWYYFKNAVYKCIDKYGFKVFVHSPCDFENEVDAYLAFLILA